MRILPSILISSAILTGSALSAQADRCAYFPMDVTFGKITETVSGAKYSVNKATVAENIPGAKGNALRLDGYSNYVAAQINCGELTKMTFSLWCAMETYPIIEHDVQNETDMTCIAGNYDTAAKQGFGFFINRTGKLSFRYYTAGWPVEIVASTKLPLYQWNNLVAVADGTKITIYLNGNEIGSSNGRAVKADGTFMIGRSTEDRTLDRFLINTVNGLIDEIEIYNEALPLTTIRSWKADNEPLLGAVASNKYANDVMRPAFHGMPARNWTNESHGLIYRNGRYHVFFQKNANGPYMSRLQWGHIVSDNLYKWEEMPIAIGSDHWYDLKGCWSGCIAVDNEVTGGKPNIIYTGVDYARAMIGKAEPLDDDLIKWTKPENPIIDGRPAGLSDDFRDAYFFRNGSNAYIIVGTSKDGRGACTLHKYDPATKTWSNDGKIFFQATSAATQGTFWEMPNVTKMGDKWLFTVTPLGLNTGVKAMYWVGTINADGTFQASTSPASIEFSGFAKDGYGLLSPSITQVGGKTIALGIVPDKLPSKNNYDLGWAHTYSLPREWSLNDAGQLIQKPYAGLEAMRDQASKVEMSLDVSDYEKVADMHDRQIEVIGEFTVGNADFGLAFYSEYGDGARLYYSPSSAKLVLDMRQLVRWHNDDGPFGGLYTTSLPKAITKGSVMKMHVFIDHSIMDIFINDMWATSVRLFPTANAAESVEVFSEGGSTQANVTAYNLNVTSTSGVGSIQADDTFRSPVVDVYSITGMKVRSGVDRIEATAGLPAGLYIVDGKKIMIR